eukprot:527896-Pleurochrysis_carterae.AAC.1
MQPSAKDPVTVSITQPSWDSSQISICAWVDDLLAWIHTCDQFFAPLIEQGYVLTSHGRVVVASKEHAIAVYHRIYSPYPLHSPSPLKPTFNLAIASLPAAVRAHTRSATAADASSAPSNLTLRNRLMLLTTTLCHLKCLRTLTDNSWKPF